MQSAARRGLVHSVRAGGGGSSAGAGATAEASASVSTALRGVPFRSISGGPAGASGVGAAAELGGGGGGQHVRRLPAVGVRGGRGRAHP